MQYFDEVEIITVKRIISYFIAYGNTRIDDLIGYIVGSSDLRVFEAKEIVEKMVFFGLLGKVVHDRVKPSPIYLEKGKAIPVSMELQAFAGLVDLANMDEKDVEGAKLILDQANFVAKNLPNH